MKWISVKDQIPPQTYILVICKNCNTIHLAGYDYGSFEIQEGCSGAIGGGIEFDYWMTLPDMPKEMK